MTLEFSTLGPVYSALSRSNIYINWYNCILLAHLRIYKFKSLRSYSYIFIQPVSSTAISLLDI